MSKKKSNTTKIKINKDEIYKSISFFTKRRYDFVIVIFSFALLYLSYNLSDSLDVIKQKDKYIEKISSYATYITDTGVIKQYEKEKFNVYKEKGNVAHVLSQYLVQSAYKITDGYKIATFENGKSLYRKYKPFQDFYNNFIAIDTANANEKQKEDLKNIQLQWKQILRWFSMAVNNNELPQTIEKKEDSIDFTVWNTNKNKFNIVFTMPVYVSSRNKFNVIDEGVTKVMIQASGYYNLMDKTNLNPYGMKFTSIKLVHPTIDNSKRK